MAADGEEELITKGDIQAQMLARHGLQPDEKQQANSFLW
ncbi:hypothetical protein DLM_2735 [Aquitalea magnusonii]|jgi:hypothetical protein|uniref:Uncharacterized protein n=1 Tax=Aquitalea magnusonii TaxID=332411 RepID=A0A3G9GM61_9NEIS|nr:hypothetical protein DLM_2735 [Aquitalea magnusonii]